MNEFVDVLKTIKETVPKPKLVHSLWYIVNDNPKCHLKVSHPDPFDNYADIVARVTLFYDNNAVYDTLISYNTDLTKFCEKLSNKIKELTALNGGVS